MLRTIEKEHIEDEIKKLPFRRAAAIEALLIVQKHRGFIDDEILKEIALFLDMSSEELDSIATFYNLIFRRPVGKNVIRICDSVSCFIVDYKKIYLAIKNYLNIDFGQTSKDGNFTLIPAQCLGCCDKAPALMINDDLYCDLSEEKIIAILKSYQEKKDDN